MCLCSFVPESHAESLRLNARAFLIIPEGKKWSNGVMEERPALLIIDMVKDNLNESKPVPIYRKNVLYPLFRIMPSEQFLAELSTEHRAQS
jgi:hypothetical protein